MMTTGSPTKEARERLERLGLSGSVNEAALLTRIEELLEIVAAHEKDKAELQRDKEELKQDKNELRDSNKDLRDANASLRVENKELCDTNTGLRSDVEELTQKLETADTQSDLMKEHVRVNMSHHTNTPMRHIPEGIELDDDGDPMDDDSLAALLGDRNSKDHVLLEVASVDEPAGPELIRLFISCPTPKSLLIKCGGKGGSANAKALCNAIKANVSTLGHHIGVGQDRDRCVMKLMLLAFPDHEMSRTDFFHPEKYYAKYVWDYYERKSAETAAETARNSILRAHQQLS